MFDDGKPLVPQGGAQNSRRSDDRQITVLINAGITTSQGDGLCRVRNVSAHGMAIESRISAPVGSEVTLQLRSGRSFAGNVRWERDGRMGLEIPDLDMTDLLNDRVSYDVMARSGAFPRFRRMGEGTIIHHQRRHPAFINAISMHDVSFITKAQLLLDDVVQMVVPQLCDSLARVVAQEEFGWRILLTQPLNFRALEGWLMSAERRD